MDLLIYTNFICQGSVSVIINDIKEKKPKIILYWNATEFELTGEGKFLDNGESMLELSELLIEHSIKMYVVHSTEHQTYYEYNHDNFRKKIFLENPNIKLLFWPTALLHLTKSFFTKQFGEDYLNYQSGENFDKLFMCLNNRPHRHRCMLIDELFKNDLFNNGKISWHHENDAGYNDYNFKYWSPKKMLVDGDSPQTEFVVDSNCLINLVTESCDELFFITEKTYKPILYGQIFLLFAFQNQNYGLRKYGFELYDEIIDYSFDNEPLIENRIKGIIKNLNNLKNQNYKELYNKVKHKIHRNKKRATEILFSDTYVPIELLSIFKSYNTTFNEYSKNNVINEMVIKSMRKSLMNTRPFLSGQLILNDIININNPDFLLLSNDLNHIDITVRPFINLILEKNPKDVVYHLPTECTKHWIEKIYNDQMEGEFEIKGQFVMDPNLIELEKVLVDKNIKFYTIFGSDKPSIYKPLYDNETKLKNFELLFWPSFLILHTFYGLRNLLLPVVDYTNLYDLKIDKKFDYLFINYNNKPRLHRCKLVDELYASDLFNKGRISWNILSTTHEHIISDILGVHTYTFKNWQEERLDLDDYINKSTNGFVDEYTPSLIKPNALIEVVSETSKDVSFITEKTYRPMFLEQIFICLGAVNQNLDLLKYGFEIYDEIFDYSFDSNPDLDVRVQGIIDNLNKIKDLDYYEIYDKLEPKIKRNKQRLFEILENDIYNPYISLHNKYCI